MRKRPEYEDDALIDTYTHVEARTEGNEQDRALAAIRRVAESAWDDGYDAGVEAERNRLAKLVADIAKAMMDSGREGAAVIAMDMSLAIRRST